MVRILFAALFAALFFFGWTTPTDATAKRYFTSEGAAHTTAAGSFKAIWRAARTICVEAGFALESKQFKRCFTEYQLHSLRALRAKGLTDAVAKKHGLCIDKKRFEYARCEEI